MRRETASSAETGIYRDVTPLLSQRPRRADRAFERLYRRRHARVYRYALAVLHNQADAEDVTQATFLGAYRAFRRRAPRARTTG